MKLSLAEIAAEVIQVAKTLNLEASLTLYQGQELEFSLRHTQFEELIAHDYAEAELLIYFQHHFGRVSVASLDPEVLRQALQKAATIARMSKADPARSLPNFTDLAFDYSVAQLALDHPNYPAQNELRSTLAALEANVQQNLAEQVALDTEMITFAAKRTTRLLTNTLGFCGTVTTTNYDATAAFVAEKTGVKVRGNAYMAARDFKQLDFERLISTAKKRTLMSLDAKTIKPQCLPVIFAAPVAVALFHDLLRALNGKNIYHKASFLTNRLGETVLAPHLTLISDPSIPAALGSKPFDYEGVKVRPVTLIDKGILTNYLLDSYSARRLKLADNGHSGGVHNLKIISSQPEVDFKTLLKQMDNGLLVTELMGGDTNLLTGNYTCGIFGYEIRHGEIAAPIKGATITGNLNEMFKDIVAISNDCENNSPILTGSIWIKQLVVSGRN